MKNLETFNREVYDGSALSKDTLEMSDLSLKRNRTQKMLLSEKMDRNKPRLKQRLEMPQLDQFKLSYAMIATPAQRNIPTFK